MLQNLHTHTTFCDGRNSPEDTVKRAIELGFDSIGFSGHAPTEFAENYEMRDVSGYRAAICGLKKKYEGKIDILLGIEMDYYSVGITDPEPYDYRIASVHTSKYNGDLLYFDLSAESTENSIMKHFGGDSTAFARVYYERVAELPYMLDADFIGHFDIVTKFSEKYPRLIDTDAAGYRAAALEALHTVRRKNEFFEVNTGAIGRGYRTAPYPAPFILDEMKKIGAKLLLSSDCHNAEHLDIHFAEAREYIKAHGFGELYYLTENGFVGEKI